MLSVSGAVCGAAFALGAAPAAQADDPAPTVSPQASSPTPDLRPDRPPAEAINCARPARQDQRPELDATGALQVTIDEPSRKVILSISRSPGSATCYVVFREPSERNPVLFAYASGPISAPPPAPDPSGINSAGRYCYSLIFGSTAGNGAPFETCIDIPATFAPLPTPTQPFTPPPPPGIGPPDTGTGPGNSSGFGPSQLGLCAIGFAALLAGGYWSLIGRFHV